MLQLLERLQAIRVSPLPTLPPTSTSSTPPPPAPTARSAAPTTPRRSPAQPSAPSASSSTRPRPSSPPTRPRTRTSSTASTSRSSPRRDARPAEGAPLLRGARLRHQDRRVPRGAGRVAARRHRARALPPARLPGVRMLRPGGGAASREPADDGAGERRGDQCAGHVECVPGRYGGGRAGRERAASAVLSRTSEAKVPRRDQE